MRKSSRSLVSVFLTLFALLGSLTFAAPAQAHPAGPCYFLDIDMKITGNSYCSGALVIPKEVTGIGDNAFQNNLNITSLTFEARTTEPLTIGYSAFANASNLRGHLVFPATTTAVLQYAFYGTNLRCYTNLSTVTITTENLDNTKQVPECGPYTVTYDLGGGSGTAPTQASGETDSTFSVASDTDIYNAGYTFVKWHDWVGDWNPTDTYTIGVENVTLTAVWSENAPTGGQATISSIAIATTPAVYQQSNLITVTVGETGVTGRVGFFQNGRSIPKCTKVVVNTSSRIATCAWKPANLGSATISAIFTPKSNSYTASAKKTTSVRVSPRS